MKRDELDRSFGETPQIFSDRIDDTLRGLKEERPVRKFTLRTAALAMLIALTVCGMAYAIVAMQGQEWYYNNRFTAYQEHVPEKQQAILDNLQTDVPQEDTKDAAGLITMTVQDYAWVEAQKLFTLSMAARATDSAAYELHPMQSLDADGWEDDRTDHWLWTEKGFGLPKDVMLDPAKKLLLVDYANWSSMVTIGDTDCAMPESSYDAFDGTDGASIFVMEFDLGQLDDEAIRAAYTSAAESEPAEKTYTTLRPLAEGETIDTQAAETTAAVEALKDRLCLLGYMDGYDEFIYDEATQQAVQAFQQANGLTPDGIAGTLTQQTLFSDAAIGADGTGDAAWLMSPAHQEEQRAAIREQMLAEAAKAREAIAQSTDENGFLTLCLHYTVTPLEDGELGEASEGKVSFQVKIK